MLTRRVVLPRGCPGQGRIRTAHNEGQGGAGGIQVQPEGAGVGARGAWAEAQAGAGTGRAGCSRDGKQAGAQEETGSGAGQGVRGLMAPESGWFPKSRAFRFHRGAGPAKGPGPGVSGIRGEMESGIKCAG